MRSPISRILLLFIISAAPESGCSRLLASQVSESSGTCQPCSTQVKLVTNAASANAALAAVQLDGIALTLQTAHFGGAEGGVLRSRLSDREVAVLDVSFPGANASRRVQAGGQRANAAPGRSRNDLDDSGAQDHAGQRVTGQVGVHGECTQTIGADVAAAALRHFLVRIEHVDGRAKAATGRAGIGYTKGSVRSASSVGVREIVHLQGVGRGWRG